MYNRNINGMVNISPKLSAITSDAGISEKNFGIMCKALLELAKGYKTDYGKYLEFIAEN